jgi:hypothetical protein
LDATSASNSSPGHRDRGDGGTAVGRRLSSAETRTDLVGLQRALATWIFARQAGLVTVAAVLFAALR